MITEHEIWAEFDEEYQNIYGVPNSTIQKMKAQYENID